MAQNKENLEENKSPIAQKEEEILKYWKENNIFEKSLARESPSGEFVFYEGPPTANGKPGIHHLESRAFKDAIPRYKTMLGFHVRRKAGWDTHGLPVEIEVEKQLGLKSKKEIEEYGIAKFNKKCRENAWTYIDEWQKFTERIGFWLDLNDPYVTYSSAYMEKLWGIVKKIADDGLLYKDYKVLPWCPRCGTALSSHELAQGYQNIKDLSVYVKFKVVGEDNTYLLAWTTTPWTLLGNVALAVGNEIDYILADIEGEEIWLAKDRLMHIDPHAKVLMEGRGSDLVGKKYEPLYGYLNENISAGERGKLENAFKIYPADFVTTEEGTGIVHTAVMYGQDDFELGNKVNLPKFHLVDETGHFTAHSGIFAGKFVKDEETAIEIVKDLSARGLLLKKEKYEHSYPFCWRCDTPLIYYARDSWYVAMSKLRNTLLSENKKINWEPDYIKEGRFGEWLRDVKDWAFSRERFWGTPLPLWISEDGSEMEVMGSVEDIKKKIKKSGNKYFVARHGEAEHNLSDKISYSDEKNVHLTDKGKEESLDIAEKLRKESITKIFSSPFIRTRETAGIIASALGLSKEGVVFDERLGELNPGVFEGKTWTEKNRWIESQKGTKPYRIVLEKGESHLDAKIRFGNFLYDIESKYKNENILIITHGVGIEVLPAVVEGADDDRSYEIYRGDPHFTGALLLLDFTPIPHDEEYVLDLHKPYIDEIELVSKSGNRMKRVPEVIDVWFDSGSMPFAQDSKLNSVSKEIFYPADFISEGVDQTRGWFYTLHAIGILMGKGLAYRNAISLGHILDNKGQKMSKSRGNVVNPWEMIDKYGVDPLRFWMYSVNQPGEPKNFDEKTVDEIVKKVFNLFNNVVNFYKLYKTTKIDNEKPKSNHVLDEWIMAKLDRTTRVVTQKMETYKVLEAAREIREFVAELSQWYLRRSRDRFKSEDVSVKENALATLGFVILQFSKIVAPFAPFWAEGIYKDISSNSLKESVHLENWPEVSEQTEGEEKILNEMEITRKVVSIGLEARAKAGIKVKQPLQTLFIKDKKLEGLDNHIELVLSEVNVKNLKFMPEQEEGAIIDTKISKELKEEGDIRELVRLIQEKRRESNLTPGVVASGIINTTEEYSHLIKNHTEEIKKMTNLNEIKHEILSAEKDGSWFEVKII